MLLIVPAEIYSLKYVIMLQHELFVLFVGPHGPKGQKGDGVQDANGLRGEQGEKGEKGLLGDPAQLPLGNTLKDLQGDIGMSVVL